MLTMRMIEGIHGFVMAMYGMREPYKTTEKSDSRFNNQFEEVGPKDLELAEKLAKAGSTHAKYRRMIQVWVEVTAPLYWWKEFDTYKVGTVANSESTMHTIEKKPFELDDFSYEHLMIHTYGEGMASNSIAGIAVDHSGELCYYSPQGFMKMTCQVLNRYRRLYLDTKDKKYWWQMIQLLPSSYNQTRMVCLNYEVLSHIYADRRDHKLDEWHTFCDWIEELPYAKEMIFPVKVDVVKPSIGIGKTLLTKLSNNLYQAGIPCSKIAEAMDIPESVVRSLIEKGEVEE